MYKGISFILRSCKYPGTLDDIWVRYSTVTLLPYIL